MATTFVLRRRVEKEKGRERRRVEKEGQQRGALVKIAV
jgi:hypothetical protein